MPSRAARGADEDRASGSAAAATCAPAWLSTSRNRTTAGPRHACEERMPDRGHPTRPSTSSTTSAMEPASLSATRAGRIRDDVASARLRDSSSTIGQNRTHSTWSLRRRSQFEIARLSQPGGRDAASRIDAPRKTSVGSHVTGVPRRTASTAVLRQNATGPAARSCVPATERRSSWASPRAAGKPVRPASNAAHSIPSPLARSPSARDITPSATRAAVPTGPIARVREPRGPALRSSSRSVWRKSPWRRQPSSVSQDVRLARDLRALRARPRRVGLTPPSGEQIRATFHTRGSLRSA
jgi:hypothetical protein